MEFSCLTLLIMSIANGVYNFTKLHCAKTTSYKKYFRMNNNIDMTQFMQAAIQQRQQQSKGLSYFELLSLILVTLKCMGIITCSWIWPFFPVFIPMIVYVLYYYLVLLNPFL